MQLGKLSQLVSHERSQCVKEVSHRGSLELWPCKRSCRRSWPGDLGVWHDKARIFLGIYNQEDQQDTNRAGEKDARASI